MGSRDGSRCELEADVCLRSNLLLQWALVMVSSSVLNKRLNAMPHVNRSPIVYRPVYVLGINEGKEQYEVERLRPLLQRVSLAWTRRMVKNLGQAKVVQSLVGIFLTTAKSKSPLRSKRRARSSARPRTEGPHATAWENGTLEDAGVDFTVAQLTKHALLDPLTQAGVKTGVVLLRRDTFEKEVVGQIQSSRPLAVLLPAAEGELEQMRTEAQAKGFDILIETLKRA